MRRIVNSTYISLDGVVEQPHLWPSIERPADERGIVPFYVAVGWVVGGYLEPSDRPGLGVELNEPEMAKYPFGGNNFLRLFEDDRVVNHRGALFAHAIEQASMVVPIEARFHVVHAECADEPIVKHQRTDQG